MATVLDTIKAKPDGGRLNAASLDSACARWRSRFCGRGGRKPAARSNKRNMSTKGRLRLHSGQRLENGSGLSSTYSSIRSSGRGGHVFGLSARLTSPLAIMPFADRVPVKTAHSTMLWPKWGVPITGSTGLHYLLSALSNRLLPPLPAQSVTACSPGFTWPAPLARDRPRPWPSSPRPCVRSYWPARWRPPSPADARAAWRARADAAHRGFSRAGSPRAHRW
jgi:hypothetical protein